MTSLLILFTSFEADDFVVEDIMAFVCFDVSGIVSEASDRLLLVWLVVEEVVLNSIPFCISADVFVELLEMMRSTFSGHGLDDHWACFMSERSSVSRSRKMR